MKKFTLFIATIYILIITFFAILNWNVFMLELDVNLGVRIVQFPLLAGIFLIGLFFFTLLWIYSTLTNIIMNKKLAKTNQQLNKIKDSNNSEMENKLEKLFKIINELKDKIDLNSGKISITK
ncbi:MAG: hypothetical protein OQJ81_09840 [Melioribacteraceae bacterium]|nr:hypothetical protein [Melioribacteraceae bacterium]